MKNKILLTAAMALLGLFTFSTSAEAHNGRGGRGTHKHVYFERGNRVVIWHNNYNQCRNNRGFRNGWNNGFNRNNRMCHHMRNIWRGGNCGPRAVVRCNSRGCGMFGNSFRNGRFYNHHRGHGNLNGRGNRGGRFNQGGGRGNGRLNQGGRRGDGDRYNQGDRYDRDGRGYRGRNGNGRGGNGRGGR